MRINDLSKDVKRLLLEHWSTAEIEDRLSDPEYFFEHVVIPRLAYLKRSGHSAPVLRVHRTPAGELRVFLNQ